MADLNLNDALRDDTRTAWHRFIDATADFRPDFHRYCRSLTSSTWDAEDLVQEALLRAFSQLGSLHQPIENPRAYLVRIASNLWIDQIRFQDRETAHLLHEWETFHASSTQPPDQELRADAGDGVVSLFTHLAPQERAALLLKDVFGFSLNEAAYVLSTSTGAVKSALHRARSTLKKIETTPARRVAPPREVVQAFVDLMTAADMDGLLELMHEQGSVAYHGCLVETGIKEFGEKGSWFDRATHGHHDWPEALQPPRNTYQMGFVEDQPVAFGFNDYGDGQILTEVIRMDMNGEKIQRLNSYGCCPQVVGEVAHLNGFKSGPAFYRFPTPEPGKYWADAKLE